MAANFPSVQRGNTFRLNVHSEVAKLRDGFPVTVKPSAVYNFVVDIQGAADVVAFYASDFSADGSGTAITFPFSVFWQVRVGAQCEIDQARPAFQGVTLFTSADDLHAREGLLVQVSGLYAERWTLWTRVGTPNVAPGPAFNCNVYGQAAVTGCVGPLAVQVGSVIG